MSNTNTNLDFYKEINNEIKNFIDEYITPFLI